MTIYISNAFSLQMVRKEHLGLLKFSPCVPKYIDIQNAVSIVGHTDTARVLGVNANRQSIILNPGDVLYVAQVVGGRLPEGATKLPEDAHFEWISASIG